MHAQIAAEHAGGLAQQYPATRAARVLPPASTMM
jgi:hypothetical protein